MNRTFRLRTLLRLRAQQEKDAATALRTAGARLTAARERAETMALALTAPADPAGTPDHPLARSGEEFVLAAHHRDRLRDELAAARDEVTRLEDEVVRARGAWAAARSALRAVEVLRERHLLALRRHEARLEQREADELALVRHQRRAVGGAA